jgi:alpha-ketoglutarate-dependent taurine dioxygenase/4-hydroxybenzoate polyprenyltransferase
MTAMTTTNSTAKRSSSAQTLTPLSPFGLQVSFAPGTAFSDIDIDDLRAWTDAHKVVVLRGLTPSPPHVFAAEARRLGPLQPWSFGAVHELKVKDDAENYLYTAHEVPLHWDGAFAGTVPHWLVFQCVAAPPAGAGGETVFVDTAAVLARATPAQRTRWQRMRVRYTTEKKAHYGGSFVSPIVARHPTTDADVIRYAEPVVDLNPVHTAPLGLDDDEAQALIAELATALHAPEVELAIPWEAGDYVVADNHATLHGRRAFTAGAPRHIYRVNVLDDKRDATTMLRALWRVRRPEFFKAELPILLIPAFLCAPSAAALASLAFVEATLLFFLLFNIGDMINCWFDRDVDLHRKTHLAEAIARVGARALLVQIVLSSVAAALLGLHLGLSLDRSWLAPAGVVGAVLAASYSAPPLYLKGRGLLQIVSHIGLLFSGPMIMVSGVFLPWPSFTVVAASIAYGVMQTGVLLVNNAEDLDEDEREGIRTAAVVMGSRGTIVAAVACVVIGALAFVAVVAAHQPLPSAVLTLPVLACAAWNARWLLKLRHTMRDLDEASRRAAIRAQGKYVPRRIETGALVSLLVVAAITLVRWWPDVMT